MTSLVRSRTVCTRSPRLCVVALLPAVRIARRGVFHLLGRQNAYRADSTSKEVSTIRIHADRLDKSKVFLDKKAYGIPFHVSDSEAVDAVCRHHATSVEIHSVERYLLPFWLLSTSAGGSFRAELLQQDPAFMTQRHAYVWVEGPRYEFSYPFGEYLPINQIGASYVEPLSMVESCLAGTHVPAMLISRFELLKELEAMPHKPKVIPFAMSTVTALSIAEKRTTRRMVLDRIDKELKKFHGAFVKSNVTVTNVFLEATRIRPAFLPLMKLMVSTTSHPTPVPAFVCGATGRVVGPVLHLPPSKRLGLATTVMIATLLGLAPLIAPGTATAGAIAAAVTAVTAQNQLRSLRFHAEQSRQLKELQTTGLLNLAADSTGYRWTPDDEERQEYEYREELRRRAKEKEAFEQRVKEDAARDKARRMGNQFDPKHRRRTDLIDADPLGYYELLGLKGREFSATSKEISRAFREAVRVHHPDVSVSKDEEGKKQYMQKIIEAYKILSNPKSKKAYDAGEMQKASSVNE